MLKLGQRQSARLYQAKWASSAAGTLSSEESDAVNAGAAQPVADVYLASLQLTARLSRPVKGEAGAQLGSGGCLRSCTSAVFAAVRARSPAADPPWTQSSALSQG